MDSPDKLEPEPSSFRKISSDRASRSYRRRGSDSPPSDEIPKKERNKNYNSSKSEREIEKTNSHNRSDRETDRNSERPSRRHYDDYKSHDYNHKNYDDKYDYKNRSKDHARYKKEENREYNKRENYNRDKERKDYYNERDNEKRKYSEHSSSFNHEIKPRESKFSKPDNKDIDEKPDINAAKAAAIKAADSVNKKIGGPAGGGSLTTEQKKKMLWGNKKNESTQKDITKNWDLNLFADRERQEKFNKLMGVKGQQNSLSAQESEPKETKKIEELETDLEKQYTAGLRRRDGRTVGLGL